MENMSIDGMCRSVYIQGVPYGRVSLNEDYTILASDEGRRLRATIIYTDAGTEHQIATNTLDIEGTL
jgi:hypothetical protein